MTSEDFLNQPEFQQLIKKVKSLKGKIYSDIIDDKGNQYVDLVQEAGGVFGIALAGYTSILETAGIRFFHLAGSSIGSINTLLLGSIDSIEKEKSKKILDIIGNQDMFEFVDGDPIIRSIMQKIIEGTPFKNILGKILWNFRSFKKAIFINLGLNPGIKFEIWIDKVLKESPNKITTIGELIEKRGKMHFPKGLKHRISGKALTDDYAHMHIITADITTKTQVQFPKFAHLYWGDKMWEKAPSQMVRAAMSVPFFFVPFEIDNIPNAGENENKKWIELANFHGPVPSKAKFVDGGMISNFPINIFHSSPGAAPRKPTFGVKQSSYREESSDVDDLGGFMESMISTMRGNADNEFLIQNPDFKKLICFIDADKDFNWLNFQMSDEKKKKLFLLGAKRGLEFLQKFDWEAYKNIRGVFSSIKYDYNKSIINELETSLNETIEKSEKNPESIDLKEKLIELYERLGDKENADIISKELSTIKKEEEYLSNQKTKIKLIKLSTENIFYFNKIDWKFCSNVNVLLGKNGYGKSFLLKLIVASLQQDIKNTNIFLKGTLNGEISIDIDKKDRLNSLIRDTKYFSGNIGKIPLLAISDSRYINKSTLTIDSKNQDVSFIEKGSSYFINEFPMEEIIKTFLYNLSLDYYENNKTKTPIFKLLEDIIFELTEDKFEIIDIINQGDASFKIEVIAEGNKQNPIPIQKASQGTLSVLSIIGLIYYYLKAFAKYFDLPTNEIPGIVFIDEIDAHLHPQWQKKIVRILRKSFPNVQFILTAHSPLIVSGCLRNEVSIMRKLSEGSFTLDQINEDFIKVSPDDLYKKVFDIEEIDDNFEYYGARPNIRNEISNNIRKLQKKEDNGNLMENEKMKLTSLLREDHISRRVLERKKDNEEINKDDKIFNLEGKVRSLERKLKEIN